MGTKEKEEDIVSMSCRHVLRNEFSLISHLMMKSSRTTQISIDLDLVQTYATILQFLIKHKTEAECVQESR